MSPPGGAHNGLQDPSQPKSRRDFPSTPAFPSALFGGSSTHHPPPIPALPLGTSDALASNSLIGCPAANGKPSSMATGPCRQEQRGGGDSGPPSPARLRKRLSTGKSGGGGVGMKPLGLCQALSVPSDSPSSAREERLGPSWQSGTGATRGWDGRIC